MKDMKKIVGENLSDLRKSKKLTQFELAEKFNYSDKAVSKWENGDTLPDFETLNNLAVFYGVTLDYFTHPVEENKAKNSTYDSFQRSNHIAITSLVISSFWIIATIVFVYTLIKINKGYWLSFVWALLPSAITLIYFNKKWFKSRKLLFIIGWTIFIWGLITCVFLNFIELAMWPLFLVGLPLEVSLFLWASIKKK